MTIIATVLGVRLWPQSKGSRRVVSLGWVVDKDDDFHQHFTIDIDDAHKEFDLGDTVEIWLTHAANQERSLGENPNIT